MTDDVDDIFDNMDRIFGRRTSLGSSSKPYMALNKHERQIDEDNIYYTLELRNFNKEDINVTCVDGSIVINFSNEKYPPYNMKLPYPIQSNKMKVTFRNGILDIICPIDKKQRKKVLIE